MHWLSKSAEQLINACEPKKTQHTQDVVVIGSGYGGAVAAMRFAEHGLKVTVLERGKEYVAGEFPNDVSQVGKHVRSELAAVTGVTTQGYEDGLFDFRVGLRAGALIGNGLGGGSLINAGVGLQPDDRVFKQAKWPAALQQENLTEWYDKAREKHELQTPGRPRNGKPQQLDMTLTSKYKRLKELQQQAPSGKKQAAGDAKVNCVFEPAPIAVQLDSDPSQDNGPRKPCNGCGDCVTGCNYNAKLTLTATYLPKAVKAGAEIYTGLTVLHVSYEPKTNPAFPWVVHYIRTNERKLQHEISKNNGSGSTKPDAARRNQWVYKLRARRVVVSAGTFGSTEIMLRSRVKGLSLTNTALGMGVSGNGDDVAYGYHMKAEANATGTGSRPTQPVLAEDVVGPTITGIIRFTDLDDVKRSTLTQDGAVPGLISGAVDELLTTLATVAQLRNLNFRKPVAGDPLAIQPAALKRSLTLLGMGHDSADGVIVYDAKTDRAAWGWPTAADEKTPKLHRSRMRGLVKRMGGLYLQNPAAGVLPEGLGAVQSGPQAGGLVFTVHPLGGCRMGDSVITSVVNHWGCAWTAQGELHDGLYVMDGSVVPSSLGANPMLTITALAERACSLILKDVDKKNCANVLLPAYPAAPQPLAMGVKPHSSTRLAEVLRGDLSCTANLAPGALVGKSAAALFLQFDINDWQGLLAQEDHRVDIVKGDSKYKKSRLVIDQFPVVPNLRCDPPLELLVTGGQVNLFYQDKHSWLSNLARYCRTVATFAISNWYPEYVKNSTVEKKEKACKKLRETGTDFVASYGTRLVSWVKKKLNKYKRYAVMTVGALVLSKHANEVRAFDYCIHLCDSQDTSKVYFLKGRKTIEAAASCGAVWRQLTTRGWPVLERRSVWQQLTELDVKLYAGKYANEFALVAVGRVVMDLPDMLRRVLPEQGTKGDSLNALLELAGYPMLFARAILKTRLFDFKLPDYAIDACGKSTLPDVDPALVKKPPGHFELDSVTYPPLQISTGQMIAPVVTRLDVDRSWPKSPTEKVERIRLGLVRYKHPKLRCNPEPGGAFKAKSIILMNGFDLSTKPFVAEELDGHGGNLATNLLNAGWDVWLFEYRASPLLDASAQYATMDEIAAFDIPAAVDHVLGIVSAELQTPVDKTQIFTFTHCVGSASMAMSLLARYLERPSGVPKLAGVSFSQFHTQVVGSTTAQMRLQLAALLSNVLKIETLEFTANTVKADFIYAMFDRLFASGRYWQTGTEPDYAHQVYNQCCPRDADLRELQPESATCKRMAGLLSRLFEHDQLLPATHEKLGDYFGRSNLGVYMQGAKCTEYERLVNADGQNVYVTDDNVRYYMNMPLMLIQGQKNVLFNKESATRSWDEMQRIRSDSPNIGLDMQLNLKDYAHFDCTIGKNAARDVFQPAVQFFNNAFQSAVSISPSATKTTQPAYIARMPRTGPIVGWIRPGTTDTTLIRVWIEIDDTDAEAPCEVLSYVTCGAMGAAPVVQSWPIQNEMLTHAFSIPLAQQNNPNINNFPLSPTVSYAVANIEVPNTCLNDIEIEMVSIHASRQNGAPSVLTTTVNPHGLLSKMKDALDARNDRTRLPDPDTLSRKRKTLRAYKDKIIHLQRTQLATHVTGDLTFIAGGCKHPGLTGFERGRADGALNNIVEHFQIQPPPVAVANRADPLNRQHTCTIRSDLPSFMLMLGDQIYADARAGVMDTQSPIEKLLPRYRSAFGGSAGFRKLAQHMPMYMVMDDHEINDDWSEEQKLASYSNKVLAENARSAFKIFQHSHSPGFPADVVTSATRPATRVWGFNYCYEQRGIPFLVLDTRSNRTRLPARRLLEPGQWLWLEQWLLAEQSKGAHPKFVVSGSVLAPGLKENLGTPSPRSADSWQLSSAERERLLSFIASNNIDNVVFLSSDYHCSAATTISFTHSKVKAWAIVAPPLHAPMRFANVQASEVCQQEVVSLSNDQAVIDTKAWDGEGWLNCSVKKDPSSRHTLELTFHLRQLDASAWPQAAIRLIWSL